MLWNIESSYLCIHSLIGYNPRIQLQKHNKRYVCQSINVHVNMRASWNNTAEHHMTHGWLAGIRCHGSKHLCVYFQWHASKRRRRRFASSSICAHSSNNSSNECAKRWWQFFFFYFHWASVMGEECSSLRWVIDGIMEKLALDYISQGDDW